MYKQGVFCRQLSKLVQCQSCSVSLSTQPYFLMVYRNHHAVYGITTM